MNTAFILGNCPELSLAEISASLNGMGASFAVIGQGNNVAELDISKHIDARALLAILGGCIKIGSWFKAIPTNASLAEILSASIAAQKYPRITYGISVSSVPHLPKNKRITATHIKRLSLEVKKLLRAQGIASRCILPVKNATILSSVQSEKNGLLSQGGIEFLLIQHLDAIHAYTIAAVQPFEEWSFRDYGRPRRSMAIGMLPPKIARMMVNISQAPFRADSSLLDPFCGTGTILQEAIVSGVRSCVGSDISNASIQSSKENLMWLGAHYPLPANIRPSLRICDASKLELCFPQRSYDAIVTETYLGPIIRRDTTLPQEEIKKLEALYAASFASFARILRPGGIVVIALPYWPSKKGGAQFLPSTLASAERLGFSNNTHSLLAPFGIQQYKRNSILFSREGQSVGREIGVFRLRT